VHADLDALVTALYVRVDDLLPKRRGRGQPERITDAELIALAIVQMFLGVPNDRRFLAAAPWRLGHLFPSRQQFELHRITGCHDFWVNEYTIRYDDRSVMVVRLMELRDDKRRPRADLLRRALRAAGWRAQWVELFDPLEPDSSVTGHQPREHRSR
jgi:hypothetical protein